MQGNADRFSMPLVATAGSLMLGTLIDRRLQRPLLAQAVSKHSGSRTVTHRSDTSFVACRFLFVHLLIGGHRLVCGNVLASGHSADDRQEPLAF